MVHLLFLCITLLSTVATLVWSEMFTFSLCITNYADTSLGCTWGHPESVLYSLGFTSSGDSSILLVSKWEPKVPLTCQWVSRPGCQLCREPLSPACAEMQKRLSLSLSLVPCSALPFGRCYFKDCSLLAVAWQWTHCEDRYARFSELTGALKPFLRKKSLNQSYALPDKLTLELILAQLILQCLIMKEKKHHSKASG